MTVHQYWYLGCDKGTILTKEANNRGKWVWGIQELPELSSQSFCKSKALLKETISFKKMGWKLCVERCHRCAGI